MPIADETPNHFSAITTTMVVTHLRDRVGPEALERMLRLAGEQRSPEELCEPGTWSSYAQCRQLLEAAATVLGGADQLYAPALGGFSNITTPDYAAVLQALGSPGALYAEVSSAAAGLSPIVRQESEEVGPTEWIIRTRFVNGFEPFKEWCWLGMGLVAATPVLFGFPPGEVAEETCQCEGAPACTIRVRWQVTDDAVHRAEYWQMRAALLEGGLEAFERAVANLVGGDDLDAVLPRVLEAAARAVPAPVFVLALTGNDRVYAEGLADEEAAAIAVALQRDEGPGDGSWLVTDVASTRQHYGRLAAIHAGASFFPQERALLEAFARLAAAALDSAAAVEEVRRQVRTSDALLGLASTLAELGTIEEIAARVARAVPAVIDCDRTVVAIPERDGRRCRVAGLAGFTAQEAARLDGQCFEIGPDRPQYAAMTVHVAGGPTPDSAMDEALALFGSAAAATFPITSNGHVVGWIAISVDHDAARITDNRELSDRLRGLAGQAATAMSNAKLLDQVRHQALHDSLTGLPNRALILDRAEHLLQRAQRDNREAAALFIDLDNFKTINDTLGHRAGDELLQAVASRITAVLRGSDTVGRLGGDEFVVLVGDVSVTAGPELVAQRVLDVLQAPFFLSDYEAAPITVSASIGIATGRSTSNDLLRDADIALYRAKAQGKGRFALFEPAMQSAVLKRLELEMDLRAGLTDELFLVYQPVFNLETMTVSGVEALLRWRHPVRGVIGPDEFIPMLEETGLILSVGRWVLHQACRQTVAWRQRGLRLNVSVNVSMRQLETDAFLDDVADALRASGLDAADLVIEVTETVLMRDADATVRRLRLLKELGVRVAIDDFGTGYSSLAYLEQFPVDALKIDRSFIASIDETRESAALMHTLVQLGRALGLETLAEGIEDPGQLARLRGENCDSGQGYLLGRPLEPAELEEFLGQWSTTGSTSA
jgi:diguanylate cyclase (GGDEF)-like protein